jgi:hypothetical protein
MAFTPKDRDDLVRMRKQVAELEVKEREALEACVQVLHDAGLRLDDFQSDVLSNWSEVIWTHADAIRDALAPFDSGVRCRDEVER